MVSIYSSTVVTNYDWIFCSAFQVDEFGDIFRHGINMKLTQVLNKDSRTNNSRKWTSLCRLCRIVYVVSRILAFCFSCTPGAISALIWCLNQFVRDDLCLFTDYFSTSLIYISSLRLTKHLYPLSDANFITPIHDTGTSKNLKEKLIFRK